MASLYQKRLAQRRKTADITRLADQYKKNVEAMTGEQDKAFAAYQADVKQKMAPYEASVAQYNTAFAQYEQQAAAYRQRFAEYESTLNQYNNDPYTAKSLGKVLGVAQPQWNSGTPILYWESGHRPLNDIGRSKQDAINRGFDYYFENDGPSITDGQVYELQLREAPKFSEKAPTAPTAPTAPKIAEFDTSEFEAKRGQLETEFKRELGERKGARLAAVSRKTTRPLMQGQT